MSVATAVGGAALVLAMPWLLGACAGQGGTTGERVGGKAAAAVETAAGAGAGAQTPAAAEVPAGYVKAEFAVEGMTCGGCALATKMALRKLDGVIAADASFDEATGAGRAWAVYDPARVTPEQLSSTIRGLGYTPAPLGG